MAKDLKYKVEKDGNGWGVILVKMDIFENQEPMTKKEAIELCNSLNGQSSSSYVYVDNNPSEIIL